MYNLAFFLLGTGGVVAWLLTRNPKVAATVGCLSCITACAAELSFALAPLYYLLPVTVVGIAAAIHSVGYLEGHAENRTGVYWLFFNFTIAAMFAVLRETSLLPFIVFWELMGVFSFFLVMFDAEEKKVVRASWIYLLACELGGLLLIYVYASELSGMLSLACRFWLLAVAFGLKAGFPLLHVWLPEAHPAAPAPVSALMSGAMIPLGFLGIFRFAIIPQGAGWFFLCIGLMGAFFGILSGMAQRNIKQLLAWSSVENIGIIATGFGLGLLGKEYKISFIEYAGFAGAFVHIVSHALLKGSLFLGAGSVFHSSGTLDMDKLGGMMKKMPVTRTAFALSAAGISGLPPFAGFTGELLIYAAAFSGVTQCRGPLFFGSFLTLLVLALTGGCACAAFCKTVGAVFQGEPRTELARNAHPETRSMSCAVLVLALLALLIPFSVPWWPIVVGKDETLSEICQMNAIFSAALYILFLLIILLKMGFKKDSRTVGTWDCGYAQPTARMEYTGTAFVQPSTDFFKGFLHPRKKVVKPQGVFPEKGSMEVEFEDFGMRFFWQKIASFITAISVKIHRFQSGYLHLYILIMVAALTAMLVWALLFNPAGGK